MPFSASFTPVDTGGALDRGVLVVTDERSSCCVTWGLRVERFGPCIHGGVRVVTRRTSRGQLMTHDEGVVAVDRTSDEPEGVSRRTIMAGAAWAVPAVVLTSASPALAVSSTLLNLTTTNMQVPASGAATVTANLKRSTGQNWAGQAVSFSGPSGATMTPTSGTTNGSGNATTSLNLRTPWAKPGSAVVVSASAVSETKSQPFTVVGANLLAAGATYTTSLAQDALTFPSPVVQAIASQDAGGSNATWFVVLLQNGSVWTKGDNSSGQLGDGTASSRSTWAQVPGLTGVTRVSAGYRTAYALLSDGTVRAWGSNSLSALGRTGAAATTPVTVTGLSGVTDIAAGAFSGYALLSNGTVKAWGGNGNGQLGTGSTTDQPTPAFVSDGSSGILSGVMQIAAAISSGYALLSDKTVRAWGLNQYGQVGDGSTTQRNTPVAVSGLTDVDQIVGGRLSVYALRSDGSIAAWGLGNNGQLGNGSTANSSLPLAVSGLNSVVRVGAFGSAACALLADGTVRTWGFNVSGQLGIGSTSQQNTPVTPTSLQGQSVSGLISGSVSGLSVFFITGQ
ncbi:RCC1 domain-containing protein [Microbacterium proteolyticum]|uniref:RCC1 domain-containing protein n=1 Tax=Microbacterium proteolyticum TaxID=1572644 RepID=UPI001FAD4B47|nr:RCC1 domain-containing protein [Microbacterium proteolyticum]MCI9858638.1 hypothetical protein [Microbacterium proteolyticum]